MPKDGISRREYRTRKFGSGERSLELDAKVVEAGKSEGIPFFDRLNDLADVVAGVAQRAR